MIASLGFKAKTRPKYIQKARYAIVNFSKKDLSNIIRDFEKLTFESYGRKRPKHKPTGSYFYRARQLVKCMMRSDALNSHVYPVGMEVNGTQYIPNSHVYSMDESELKEFIVNKTLSQICSTEEDESECVHQNINKQKDANNEADYEEYSVTTEVPGYFNIFECGRNILNL